MLWNPKCYCTSHGFMISCAVRRLTGFLHFWLAERHKAVQPESGTYTLWGSNLNRSLKMEHLLLPLFKPHFIFLIRSDSSNVCTLLKSQILPCIVFCDTWSLNKINFARVWYPSGGPAGCVTADRNRVQQLFLPEAQEWAQHRRWSGRRVEFGQRLGMWALQR